MAEDPAGLSLGQPGLGFPKVRQIEVDDGFLFLTHDTIHDVWRIPQIRWLWIFSIYENNTLRIAGAGSTLIPC